MSLFAGADPDIVLGLSMSFVLVLCLAIVLLRDPYSVSSDEPNALVCGKVPQR